MFEILETCPVDELYHNAEILSNELTSEDMAREWIGALFGRASELTEEQEKKLHQLGRKVREYIAESLTSKNDKFACAFADKIVTESKETDEWYEYFDAFTSLLNHPKSLVETVKIFL